MQEKEALEERSIPIKNYLMKHVLPTLTQGLIECCRHRPNDPIDYLVGICCLVSHPFWAYI